MYDVYTASVFLLLLGGTTFMTKFWKGGVRKK